MLEIINDAEVHSFDADHRVDLSHSIANDLILDGAPFNHITESMRQVKYSGCRFRGCSFAELDLAHSEFDFSEFVDCDFTSTDFYDVSIRDSLFQGKSLNLLDAEIACANVARSCLADADLRRAYAPASHFIDCDLDKTNFSGSNLRGANFSLADSRGSDFTGADLRGANFFRADLRGANFTSADLRGVSFRSALLGGARFDSVIIDDSTVISAEYRPRS